MLKIIFRPDLNVQKYRQRIMIAVLKLLAVSSQSSITCVRIYLLSVILNITGRGTDVNVNVKVSTAKARL
jgi:hypothetical protein